MYDRKKVTLFILLIATVVLGGLSLFLAIQINQSQAPDDSEASGGRCAPRYSELSGLCAQGLTQSGCTPIIFQTSGINCCDFDGTSCSTRAGAPSYCSAAGCAGLTQSSCVSSSANAITINNVCTWATTGCFAPGGQTIPEGSSLCNSGTSNRRYSCINGNETNSGNPLALNECCNNLTWNGTSCVAPVIPDPDPVDPDPVDPDPVDPVDPTPDPGNNTSSCTNTAPVQAQLLNPRNNSVVNTTTVTLSWDRVGGFGTNCSGNINEFRVRAKVVGLTEACPSESSGLDNIATVQPGTGDGNGIFSYNLAVQDDTKVCWSIRKRNGALATNTGIRSFTVDLQTVSPTTGGDTDNGSGSVTGDVEIPGTTGGNLPATAIISDELDPILLGMLLIIVGLVFYKFDFVSFKSSRAEE